MFQFAGYNPTENEWNTFIKMLLKEVKYSRVIEEMLHESRRKSRKQYFMFQKQLVLKEQDLEEK